MIDAMIVTFAINEEEIQNLKNHNCIEILEINDGFDPNSKIKMVKIKITDLSEFLENVKF